MAGHSVNLVGVYRVLDNPFYYGMFQYPRETGEWYQGKHEPIVTRELFEKAKAQLKRDQLVRNNKEFSFTRLFTCGLCGSGISAEEKYKVLKDGTPMRYIYYGCSRSRDRNCKNLYIREEELIEELIRIFDEVDINELGIRHKFEEEVKRLNRFQSGVLGAVARKNSEELEVDIRNYAKYLLREGSTTEKRELLGNLKSTLIYKNKTISFSENISR